MSPSTAEAVLWIHVAATLFLVGLVWFVQVVHYPLFARVGPEAFDGYARDHARRTTRVVAPTMGVELVTGAWLAWSPPPGVPVAVPAAGLALLLGIWLSTATLQVPRHARLAGGFDAASLRALVATNWIRTAAWSARGGIVLWMAARSAA